MSRDRGARASSAQMKKLLDLLSEGEFIHNGRVVYNETNKCTLWKQIATRLNKKGAEKKPNKWCKMWLDWKNKTKKKADLVLQRQFDTHKPSLNKLELRLLKVINYHADEVIRILSEEKIPSAQDEESMEGDLEESSVDCEKDNREFIYFEVQDRKDPFLATNESSVTGQDAVLDTQPTSKEANFILEKEKLHQKHEELKLKAIELKLKGEELNLKESEVQKFNYLTNLEEEKLKCMREIATSLKELVDWTRSNTRYNNVT